MSIVVQFTLDTLSVIEFETKKLKFVQAMRQYHTMSSENRTITLNHHGIEYHYLVLLPYHLFRTLYPDHDH